MHLLSVLLNSMQMLWKSAFKPEDQVLLAVVSLLVVKWIRKLPDLNETLSSSGQVYKISLRYSNSNAVAVKSDIWHV